MYILYSIVIIINLKKLYEIENEIENIMNHIDNFYYHIYIHQIHTI